MITASLRTFAVALLTLALSACVSGVVGAATQETVATKSGTGELRTDLEPLVKRFPELADADSAQWMSGTLGSEDAPGPSTYWIDAVVVLPAVSVIELRSDYDFNPVYVAPMVIESLQDLLPDGPLFQSDEFNDDLGATVYLAPNEQTVVLGWIGE